MCSHWGQAQRQTDLKIYENSNCNKNLWKLSLKRKGNLATASADFKNEMPSHYLN